MLARPKLSYAPSQPLIWITRRGYAFQHFIANGADPEAEAKARADQVWRHLTDQLASGSRHTKNTLEDTGIMPRPKLRAALAELLTSGRVIYAALPEVLRCGGRKDYLHPIDATSPGAQVTTGEVCQKTAPTSLGPETSSTSPPPYREKIGGEVERRQSFPYRPITLPARYGEVAARLARWARPRFRIALAKAALVRAALTAVVWAA